MCLKDVSQRFKLISGISEEELSDWMFVCTAAIDFIEKAAVKDFEADGELKPRLTNATAVYAFYLYSRYSADSLQSFKAGDVEITKSTELSKKAEQMWKSELADLKGILKCKADSGFCFLRM